MIGIYDAVMKVITAVVAAVMQILLVIMVAIITWLIISRQFLDHAPSWVEEISLVMIIWFGLIGATIGVRERYHLRMELFFKMFPRPVRIAVAYLVDLMILGFGVLLIVGGLPQVMLTMDQTLPATKLPGAIRYMPLPITGALIVMYGLRNLLARGPIIDADAAGLQECAEGDKK